MSAFINAHLFTSTRGFTRVNILRNALAGDFVM